MAVTRTELAGLPVEGPATRAAVKTDLAITDTRDDDRIDAIVSAVNAMVRCWPVCQAAVADPVADDWSGAAYVERGAVMLAGRLFRRKNSPAGVEAFASGGVGYVMRNDPDIAQMLQLGPWAPPSVG